MSFSIRTCPDGHSCENGSSCAQHPIKEGTYYCDCDTSPGDYAGLYCEYEAEIICQLQEETTSSWFCSNQGTCVLSTGATEAAWTCDCTDEFDGPHCQFIRGDVPRTWPGFDFDPITGTLAAPSQQYSKRNKLHTGVTVAIVLIVLIVLALTSLLISRKIRRRCQDPNQTTTADPIEALKLEADGSVLQEVMNSFSRTPDSTVTENQFDVIGNRSPDDHSVEVGVGRYCDNLDNSSTASGGII